MSNIIAKPNRFSTLLAEPRPHTETTAADIFHGWWVTSRMEFLGDSVVKVMLPLLLVLRHETWRLEHYELCLWVLVIWLFGHWVGSSINCLADYPSDRLDTGRKARLANSIDRAGIRSLLILNLAEAAAATLISVWLAFRFGKPLLPAFWLAGLLFAYFYSFEPVRLKRRNLLNPIALTFIVYVMPFAFGYHLLSPVWDLFDVAVLLTYSVQIGASFFADEVPDHDEDKAMNVLTPCVTYGRVTASLLAAVFYVLSCASSLLLFAYATNEWTAGRVVLMTLAVLAYAWVLWKYLTLARVSKSLDKARSLNARQQAIQKLKETSNTPAEIFVTSIGALLLAIGLKFL
ncbi:MAG TPA: UbiA family prenyltransferase [Blastocatellia bacterium]|jgi:4-hydroxybenzoate polyprenyltransferase